MANATVSHLGENNDAGDNNALFLTLFGQLVLASFLAVNVMMPLHSVRTIPHGE